MTGTHPARPEIRAMLRGPFTRAQALDAGLPAHTLRTKQVRTIFRGVYTWADEDDDSALLRTRAALALHPASAFASHHSAIRVHRLPAIEPAHDEHVSVFDASARRPRGGIRTHLAIPDASVVVRQGVRVSHVLDTYLELAPVVSIVDLVVIGDAIVKRQLASPDQIMRAAQRHVRPGSVAARKAARFVRAGVDSPMETRLRMLLVLAGLPEPCVNFTVRAPDGTARRRFDLSYPSVKLIVEYDGRQHADSTDQWLHDIVRREELDRQGWRLLIVTAEGIYTSPEQTISRVHDALRERRLESLPRRLSDEWRQHFPPR